MFCARIKYIYQSLRPHAHIEVLDLVSMASIHGFVLQLLF